MYYFKFREELSKNRNIMPSICFGYDIKEKNKPIFDMLVYFDNLTPNAKKELDKANTKLKNAKEDIKKIDKADIISLTTKENAGIISFDSNSEAMSSISIIFPLIFFLVAALVSLTTMTRMVEEHRVQSGTLRALGYDKKDVILQYFIYGLWYRYCFWYIFLFMDHLLFIFYDDVFYRSKDSICF